MAAKLDSSGDYTHTLTAINTFVETHPESEASIHNSIERCAEKRISHIGIASYLAPIPLSHSTLDFLYDNSSHFKSFLTKVSVSEQSGNFEDLEEYALTLDADTLQHEYTNFVIKYYFKKALETENPDFCQRGIVLAERCKIDAVSLCGIDIIELLREKMPTQDEQIACIKYEYIRRTDALYNSKLYDKAIALFQGMQQLEIEIPVEITQNILKAHLFLAMRDNTAPEKALQILQDAWLLMREDEQLKFGPKILSIIASKKQHSEKSALLTEQIKAKLAEGPALTSSTIADPPQLPSVEPL